MVKLHTQTELLLPGKLAAEMENHVDQLAPEEACGLVAGMGARAEIILPVTNQLHSAVQYRMEPAELLQALKHIDRVGLQLLAIYHSHPAGLASPSPTDLAEACYPGAIYLIWSRAERQWQVDAYAIADGRFEKTQIIDGGTE